MSMAAPVCSLHLISSPEKHISISAHRRGPVPDYRYLQVFLPYCHLPQRFSSSQTPSSISHLSYVSVITCKQICLPHTPNLNLSSHLPLKNTRWITPLPSPHTRARCTYTPKNRWKPHPDRRGGGAPTPKAQTYTGD